MFEMCHWVCLLSLLFVCHVGATVMATPNRPLAPDVFVEDLQMPGVVPAYDDEYLCAAKMVQPKEAYIVKYEVHSENNRAHHIMLFGCEDIDQRKLERRYWKCSETSLCNNMKIMFAWAKNAPPTFLPKDVGFRIGGNSGVKHLVLQIHYAHATTENDTSGIMLHMTYERQKYIAGIFLLLAQSLRIPPLQPKVHGDLNCLYESKVPIYPFAYRVHAHELGRVISGYTYNTKTKKWTLLGKGNPQWPQAFYPMDQIHAVEDSDILVARCTFNSSAKDTWTFIGNTAADEMCNFYIMYYTDTKMGTPFRECTDAEYPDLNTLLPSDSDTPLPKNPLLEEHALGHMKQHIQQMDKKGHGHHHENEPEVDEYSTEYFYEDRPHGSSKNHHGFHSSDEESPHRGTVHHDKNRLYPALNSESEEKTSTKQVAPESPTKLEDLYKMSPGWPSSNRVLGQVTAVSLDLNNNVVIFHRAKRIWDYNSFDVHNRFQHVSDGYIQDNTVIVFDQTMGNVLHEWGSNLFYMPHGLTVDSSGFIWVTDVALHQVLKFPPNGAAKPLLTLGEALVPGSDDKHFCKPTSVAVAASGEFFVADGYCNSRILKYSADGKQLLEWGKQTDGILGSMSSYSLDIPHKLTLAEEKGLICVADRENGRTLCYTMSGKFHCEIQSKEFGGRLFAISYTPTRGGLLYAVNGPSFYGRSDNVQGFVLDFTNQSLLGRIQLGDNQSLSNPHDIAVSHDASTVFIAEISPNKIWKFEAGSSKFLNIDVRNDEVMQTRTFDASASSSKLGAMLANNLKVAELNKEALSADSKVQNAYGDYTPSMIIAALVAIPLLLMILITVFVRFHKQGKFYKLNLSHIKGWMSGYKQPNNDRFNLGNFLQRHKGFDRVSMEESDGENEGSDSDVEEYSASMPKA